MDNLFYRLKAYLRKLGELDHYRMGVDADESGNWRIVYWNYDNIPQPEVSDVPMLTREEYFREYEDTASFTNDVYLVSSDGTIRADRRQYLSGLENGMIVLEPSRYCLDSGGKLKFYDGETEVGPMIKVITPTRIRVETPADKEVTVILWKV